MSMNGNCAKSSLDAMKREPRMKAKQEQCEDGEGGARAVTIQWDVEETEAHTEQQNRTSSAPEKIPERKSRWSHACSVTLSDSLSAGAQGFVSLARDITGRALRTHW